MITRIQWLAGLAAMCGTGVMCAALATVNERPVTDETKPPEGARSAPLAMEASLSHNLVSSDRATTVYARYRLRAADAVSQASHPLDVALVIDTSGSMGGDKIGRARDAARRLVERVPAGSRISLISFDHLAEVRTELVDVVQERGKLEREIAALDAGGGTNIEMGFELGREILATGARDDALRRLFVISDGQPTTGLTSPEELGQRARRAAMEGTGVTTLGVGLDFNESILGEMAIQGEGRFHFIDREGLAEALSEEVSGLSAASATHIELELVPQSGVTIADVHGFPTTHDGERTVVSVDTMFAGSTRDILVELRVAPGFDASEALVRAKLGYVDLQGDGRRADWFALHAEGTTGVVALRGQNSEVLRRARVVLSERAIDTANHSWLKYDLAGARLVLEKAHAKNELYREAFGPSDDVVRAQRRIDDLLHRITSQRPDSVDSRRYRKKKKMNSIEIIRGDR